MSLAELLHIIVPDFAPVVTDAPTLDDADLPGVADLTPGTVFLAVDESLYAPIREWFMVVEPLDAYGYLCVEAGYPDGTTSETHLWVGHLRIVEVW